MGFEIRKGVRTNKNVAVDHKTWGPIQPQPGSLGSIRLDFGLGVMIVQAGGEGSGIQPQVGRVLFISSAAQFVLSTEQGIVKLPVGTLFPGAIGRFGRGERFGVPGQGQVTVNEEDLAGITGHQLIKGLLVPGLRSTDIDNR